MVSALSGEYKSLSSQVEKVVALVPFSAVFHKEPLFGKNDSSWSPFGPFQGVQLLVFGK